MSLKIMFKIKTQKYIELFSLWGILYSTTNSTKFFIKLGSYISLRSYIPLPRSGRIIHEPKVLFMQNEQHWV
jgi:hypothetical protein